MKLKSNPSRLGDPPSQRVRDGGSWRSDKQGANARGYTYEWQVYARDFLIAHPLCMIKGKGCTHAARVVDHVIAHRGDMRLFWEPTNHQSACTHCHNVHKQRQEARQSR